MKLVFGRFADRRPGDVERIQFGGIDVPAGSWAADGRTITLQVPATPLAQPVKAASQAVDVILHFRPRGRRNVGTFQYAP